jgi:hypothetical protein
LDALWEQVEDARYGSADAEAVSLIMSREGGWGVRSHVSAGTFYSSHERGQEFLLDLLGTVVIVFGEVPGFVDAVNRVLREHRIAHIVVDGEVLPRSTDELDAAVVRPALGLLLPSRFSRAHEQYLSALKEIQRGDAGDAITDAAAALQEVLEALGCEGNALGPLIKNARRRGLLGAHDSPLVDAVEKAAHWVSADRSETGDAHHASDAGIADAWLIVHVVGALIVRLTDPGAPRSEES